MKPQWRLCFTFLLHLLPFRMYRTWCPKGSRKLPGRRDLSLTLSVSSPSAPLSSPWLSELLNIPRGGVPRKIYNPAKVGRLCFFFYYQQGQATLPYWDMNGILSPLSSIHLPRGALSHRGPSLARGRNNHQGSPLSSPGLGSCTHAPDWKKMCVLAWLYLCVSGFDFGIPIWLTE